MEAVYGALGFTYKVGLSTRNPNKFIGDIAVWDKAESQLKSVLDRVFPNNWKLNEEDGAVSRSAILMLYCIVNLFAVLRSQDRYRYQ